MHRRRAGLLVAVLAVIGCLVGSAAAQQTGSPRQERTILRLVGSGTLGTHMIPMIAASWLRSLGYSDIAANAIDTNLFVLRGQKDGETHLVAIATPGSAAAFRSLAIGEADIAMSSRPPTEAEMQALSALGDMRGPTNEHVVALDGVAVIVNRASPVAALTVRNLRDVFTGVVTDWSALGGGAGPIQVISREERSGTFEEFRAMVLGDAQLASTAQRIDDSAEVSRLVATNPLAIGIATLVTIGDARALAISEGGSRAVAPTVLSVLTEDYPLTRRLYLYTAREPRNPNVRAFLDFAHSRAGQTAVAESGFVSQAVQLGSAGAPAGAPEPYRQWVQDAQRLSVSFRFRTGSADLDAKSIRDLDRVVELLGTPPLRGHSVRLVGFTDDRGPIQANERLSQERAESVAEELRRRGVSPAMVVGAGPALPVASNDTPEGRERNRRVEIWVVQGR
jgi:phosphate transport system substrate-binding protein